MVDRHRRSLAWPFLATVGCVGLAIALLSLTSITPPWYKRMELGRNAQLRGQRGVYVLRLFISPLARNKFSDSSDGTSVTTMMGDVRAEVDNHGNRELWRAGGVSIEFGVGSKRIIDLL